MVKRSLRSKSKSKAFVRAGSVQHFKVGSKGLRTKTRSRSKSFVRAGSVQHFKVGGSRKRRKSKKNLRSKSKSKSKSFVRAGSVQHFKVGRKYCNLMTITITWFTWNFVINFDNNY